MFTEDFTYVGPLPRSCGHSHKTKLIGMNKHGEFNSKPSATYPPAMNGILAQVIMGEVAQALAPSVGEALQLTPKKETVRIAVSKKDPWLQGWVYIGRGCKERGLARSAWANSIPRQRPCIERGGHRQVREVLEGQPCPPHLPAGASWTLFGVPLRQRRKVPW